MERGLPDMPDWQSHVRQVNLTAATPQMAIDLFGEGQAAMVLGGRIGQLPLVDTGPLSRGTVRIDPAIGLFGLRVRREAGLLAEPALREAISMAIDRDALLERYNVGGWIPTTRLVAPGMPGDSGRVAERWQNDELDSLRATARRRVQAWLARRESGDGPATITVFMGSDRGDELLLSDLAQQFATIGVRLVRSPLERDADLVLVDEVARYADPRWFLNQFNCSLRRGLCSEDADYLIEVSQETPDLRERAMLWADAEIALINANVYIPFGAPLRWSLVRSSVYGFAPNPYAYHPLPALAEIPR
jgi:ABC-type transport system substrate-binding protein